MRRGFVVLAMLALLSPALARPGPALASSSFALTSSQQSFSPSIEVTAETSVTDTPTGTLVKLVAHLELGGEQGVSGLEPGQVRVVLDNEPQLLFSDLKLVLSGGPHALFVSPQACGSAGASSAITGWNGTVATPSSNVLSTSSGCTQGFSPAFTAGTTSNQAGAYSPFTLDE
jgi:hypothetical protein